MQIEVPKGYESLGVVLQMAIMQAACGKGKERHASGEPFEQQKICRISRNTGIAFALGQVIKKAEECPRLGVRSVDELLGAINYAAAGCIVLAENNGIVLGCGMSDGGADHLPKKATASEAGSITATLHAMDLENFSQPSGGGGVLPKRDENKTAIEMEAMIAACREREANCYTDAGKVRDDFVLKEQVVAEEALGNLARRSPHQPEQCDD